MDGGQIAYRPIARLRLPPEGVAAMLDAHYPVGAFYATWFLLSDAFSASEGGRRVRERMNLDAT